MNILRLLLLTLSLSMWVDVAAEKFVDTLPAVSEVVEGYTREDAERRLAEAGPHRIEGIWQFTADGATVAVERIETAQSVPGTYNYRMILIRSANRALRPGTVMGYISATAHSATYDARLYTSEHGRYLTRASRFTLKLTDDESRLSFLEHKTSVKLNLWRMLPYMFRHTVRTRVNEQARDLHGCMRLFPAPALPPEPRYL